MYFTMNIPTILKSFNQNIQLRTDQASIQSSSYLQELRTGRAFRLLRNTINTTSHRHSGHHFDIIQSTKIKQTGTFERSLDVIEKLWIQLGEWRTAIRRLD